jgi:photosystem II stability/assembly factor-like uncharacterized protein
VQFRPRAIVMGLILPLTLSSPAVPAAASSPTGFHVTWPQWKTPSGNPWSGGFLSPAGPHGVALTQGGNVFRISTDGGHHWYTHIFPGRYLLDRVMFQNARDGTIWGQIVTPAAAPIVRLSTTDGGRIWQRDATGLPNGAGLVESVTASPRGQFLAGTVSPSYSWMPGPALLAAPGRPFHALRLPPGFQAWGAAFNAAGDLFLAGWVSGAHGSHGALYESTNDGKTFSLVATAPAPLVGVSFAGHHGLAVGGAAEPKGIGEAAASQVALISTNGGAAWQRVYTREHTTVNFSRAQWIGPETALAVAGTVEIGANGPGYTGVWLTQDGGRHWKAVLSGRVASYLFQSRTSVWAIVNGVLVRSTDGGLTWAPAFGFAGLPVMQLDATPSATFIAVNQGPETGEYRTTNGGDTWTRVGWVNPYYPPVWSGQETASFAYGSSLWETASAGVHWRRVLLPADPGGGPDAAVFLNSLVGWVAMQGTADGGQADTLYRTTNGGQHWAKLTTVPTLGQISFTNRWQGLDVTGSTWGTTADGGRTWSWHPLPEGVTAGPGARVPGGPVWLFVSGSSANGAKTRGGLWIIGRGGQRQVIPVPAAAMIQTLTFTSATTGWMLANGALYRTSDGGRSWQTVPLHPPGPLTEPGIGLPLLTPNPGP